MIDLRLQIVSVVIAQPFGQQRTCNPSGSADKCCRHERRDYRAAREEDRKRSRLIFLDPSARRRPA